MGYSLNHCHVNSDLLDGFGKPEKIVARAKELGLKFISISGHGNCASHYKFIEQLNKQKMPGSVGIEYYISHEKSYLKLNRYNTHFVCWAKNDQGVKDIWQSSSYSNNVENFYYKPRLDLFNSIDEDGKEHLGLENWTKKGNICGMNGHMGTLLFNLLFVDYSDDPEKAKEREEKLSAAFNNKKGNKTSEYFKQFLKPNWLEDCSKWALKISNIFAPNNFVIELQNAVDEKDTIPLYITELGCECLRKVAKETGIPAVCSDDPHYVESRDSANQMAMVMLNLKTDENTVKQDIENIENDTMVFFTSKNFYIHDYDYMKSKFTEEEINNGNKINEGIKVSSLKRQPYIPAYKIPEFPKDLPYLKNINKDEDKYLMYLTVEGAKKIKPWLKTKFTKKQYWDRLNIETEIIFKFGLSNYFLVVWDMCAAADNRPKDLLFDWMNNKKGINPIIRGVGRGSAAGSLLVYFLGITGIDPLEYNLLFSRFLNTGRFTKEHIALPDADVDFEPEGREWVINYLKYKYGKDKVAGIMTHGRIMAKNAIKDLFRIKGIENGYAIANEICKLLPEQASIADEIQAEKDAGDKDYGIIKWALDNIPALKEYYDKYKEIFDQAMELEGIPRNTGVHPSGIAITPIPLEECFPMILDTKTKEKIVGLDYKESESAGNCKVDILGVSILSKLKKVQELYNGKCS